MVRLCTKTDFEYILSHYGRFWGHPHARPLHHPILFNEFGNTAFVIRRDGKVVAYLFGFFSQTEPTAYVHLIAVDRDHRGKGLARQLYEHFIDVARQHGCRFLKSVTGPENRGPVAFHKKLGLRPVGQIPSTRRPQPVIPGYATPGLDRVIFHAAIGPDGDGSQSLVSAVPIIRSYHLDDRPEVLAFYRRRRRASPLDVGHARSDADLCAISAVYLGHGGEFLVTFLRGKLIATGALSRASRHCAILRRVRIEPTHGRRGLGATLLRRLEHRALELGYPRLEVDIPRDRRATHRFYADHGYRRIGTTGAGLNTYQKDLAPETDPVGA